MALEKPGSRRARRWPALAVIAAGLAAAWTLSLGVAYRVGSSQSAVRADRLERELGAQGELVRDISRRAATAEQTLGEAQGELARLQRPAPNVKAAELQALGSLVDRRLGEGVTVARLAEAVAAVAAPRRCAGEPETRAFAARPPGARDPVAARFANGRILVAGTGVPARAASGRAESWIDLREPVELKLEVLGVTSRASGTLPLDHVVLQADTEYRFAARPDARKGFIEVQLKVCPPA